MTQAKIRNQTSKKTVQDELCRSLGRVDRPGTFATFGSLSPVLPGLEVRGMGPVAFPLTTKQAKEIKQHCVQAPYGKGEQTLVDTTVRRVWKLMPKQFEVKNPEWDEIFSRILRSVEEELGLEGQRLKPQIHDLLLYETGSFFLPHRDGEKLDRMVATLVITLPSTFSGGELIVRHERQERKIDFGAQPNCCFQMHYAAFYADCEHEVLPLRDGFRLCLVYNLMLEKSKESINAPRNLEHINSIGNLLRDWSTGINSRSPVKMVISLDHQYSQTGLNWDTLKGVDRTRAFVLREAARKAACKIHLAQLTFWEHGSAENYGGPGRGGWCDYDDSDESNEPGTYVMEEVYDSSLTAEHWMNDEGQRVQLGQMLVEENEVVPAASLKEVEPEEDFEGYMGNYGITLERWYRHGAIVIWPEKHHFEVLCNSGTESAIAEFSRMVHKWYQEDAQELSELRSQCIEFASRIIEQWKPYTHVPTYADDQSDGLESEEDDISEDDAEDLDIEDDEDRDQHEDEEGTLPSHAEARSMPSEFVSALETLEDMRVIQAFLSKVVPQDPSVELPSSFLRVCGKNRISVLRPQFENIFRSSTLESLQRNGRIFEQLCLTEVATVQEQRASVPAFQELLSAIKRLDKEKDDWRSHRVDRTKLLVNLVKALIVANDLVGLEELISHTLSTTQKYSIAPILVATLLELKEWLSIHARQRCALSLWISACTKHLQSRTVQKPQKPTDLTRDANVSCRCTDCKELNEFLRSPNESLHRFRVRKDRRRHLHQMIEKHSCDLDHVTERKGSPQTLICTKNINSFHRKLKRYGEDMDDLATLQSMEAELLAVWRQN